ncbi:YcxB family protein [Phyllobacterium myrsinacearum]|uniref:YcxB-like C-terminal domain-containing protein n=1 Tax=Phyllobacterium myrsinacearum TaxID=28101 RepID=A0A839EJ08_9HYPH|nr:YcxB family protein [Phyllobacterium myrsinacearum]MBA8878328.1 hypothetical protein [Phyllobacterium myrsinacearum]
MMSEPRSGTVLASTTFRVTPEDVAEMYRTYLRWSYTRVRIWLTVAALIVMFTAITAWLTNSFSLITLTPGAFILFWMIGYYPILYSVCPIVARRNVAQQKNLQQEWRTDFTENGLRAVTPTQDSFVSWSDFIGWSQNSHAFIVYQSDRLMQFIPLRALTPDMHAILQTKLQSVPRR